MAGDCHIGWLQAEGWGRNQWLGTIASQAGAVGSLRDGAGGPLGSIEEVKLVPVAVHP